MSFVGKLRRYYGGRNRNFRLINKEVRAVRSIGLITYHHTTNFGSLLQTYALYKTVTQMGYNCKVIDYRNDAVEKREFIKHIYQCKDLRELKEHIKYARFKKRKAKVFAEFLKTNLAMSDLVYDRDNVQKANQEFDTFLVGSDLVWDFSINQNDLTYMLDFADKDAVKIAYASSVGTMWESEDRETVKNLLKRFQNIGVREHSIQKELDILIGKKVDFVCDPTMLLTAEQWKSMSAPRSIEGDYVLCYMSDPKLEMYKDAIQYGKKHHLPVYLISYGWVPEGMKAIRPNGVEEFISLVSNAHTVFTASYHGMLFYLYFNRNFYYYNRGWKERMKSIAEYLQLTDREHWSDEKDSAVIDYTLVNERLNSFRTSSLRLLKEYLRRKNL